MKTPRPKPYDPQCHELAIHFLPYNTPPAVCSELAAHIQEAVEDWMKVWEDEREFGR
jgi:hypothetical protein